MGLRQNRHARALAERLPVTGPYERRIAELTQLVHERSAELESALVQLARSRNRLADGGPVAIPAAYLVSVGKRASD